MRNLLIFFAAFGALGLIVLGLQYVPLIGFVAMYLGGPLWLGTLLHLALLAMLVLALIGWLPRPVLILPLVVWLAGVSTWAYASRAAGQQALALKTSIPLAAKPREIFLRGDYQVATDLVADYEFDAVYAEFHRHQLAKGSTDCTPLPHHDPRRLMSSPPKLRARGECVISHRIDAPPGNLIEVAETPVRSAGFGKRRRNRSIENHPSRRRAGEVLEGKTRHRTGPRPGDLSDRRLRLRFTRRPAWQNRGDVAPRLPAGAGRKQRQSQRGTRAVHRSDPGRQPPVTRARYGQNTRPPLRGSHCRIGLLPLNIRGCSSLSRTPTPRCPNASLRACGPQWSLRRG